MLLLAFAIGALTAASGASGSDAGYVYGFGISTTGFDEELFEGTVAAFSGHVTVIFAQYYQLGPRIYSGNFLTPSFDRGEAPTGDDELFDISAQLLYLQRE